MNITLSDIKTLVVKVGTTLLKSGDRPFDDTVLCDVVRELAELKRRSGINVLIVSSGAIGCGMDALKMDQRPTLLPLKQAAAAVGQSKLMNCYERLFHKHDENLSIAQVLLTASDLDERQSYLNVRNTIKALFELGNVVPIVNENDSTATEEIRFGDNDTLAARIAAKIDADLLLILSDVDGLYDKDPSTNEDAQLLEHIDEVTDEIEALAGGTNYETSIGGMSTKLKAAKIASSAGLTAVIADGHRKGIINGVLTGSMPCTTFGPNKATMAHRKRWIAFGRLSRGTIVVDDGARDALVLHGKSLLAAGIVAVKGTFEVGAAVKIKDKSGKIVARGLVNYSNVQLEKIKGCKSNAIADILGRKDFDEVIHRDNLAIL